MSSRLASLALGLAVSLALAAPAAAAPALAVGAASGSPGATVQVPFTLTNDSGITALQFDVLFDAAKISAVGTPAEGSALASTDHEVDSHLVSSGRFRVLVFSNSLAVIPSGQVVVVPFTLSGSVAAGTSVPLTLTEVEMVEANAVVVASSSQHGAISVQASGCAVPGDIAPDGVGNNAVSLGDYVLARRKVGGLAQNARDAACGNVHPGAVACTPVSGKISWCPAPNVSGNPIGLGDMQVIRRIVGQTHQISCVACGSSLAAAPARIAGDLAPRGSGDGRLDVSDVVLALRTSVGLEPVGPETILGDVAPARREAGATLAEGNGIVDVGDVVLLLRAAVGLETIAWPEREIEVRLAGAGERVGFSVRVAAWPAFAAVLRADSDECPGEDSGLDQANDRWALTCATDPETRSGAAVLAVVTYSGPRVALGSLSVESTTVDAALNETSGQISLAAR